MRKIIIRLCLLLSLTIAFSYNAFSQTNDSNTATVKIDETIGFLLKQNENARTLIEAQSARIKDLETELNLEKELNVSQSKSYEAAVKEIESLKKSNAALSRAVAINEQTIQLLQSDNLKQRAKVKKANRIKWKAIAVAVGAIALEVFRIVKLQ